MNSQTQRWVVCTLLCVVYITRSTNYWNKRGGFLVNREHPLKVGKYKHTLNCGKITQTETSRRNFYCTIKQSCKTYQGFLTVSHRSIMRTCCICQLPFVRRGPHSYEKCVLVRSNYTSNLSRMSQHCFNMLDATCQLKNIEVKNSAVIVPDMLDHSTVSIYIQTNIAFI